MGRYGQHQETARGQPLVQLAQDRSVVRQMFQDVEHADDVERCLKGPAMDIRLDKLAVDTLARQLQAFLEEIQTDYVAAVADLFEHPQHVAVPAADFQNAV